MERETMNEPLALDGSVTIVGASLAGLRCAETLRAQGFSGTITMIGEESSTPYDRPPLSKNVLNGKWEIEKVTLADDAKLDDLRITTRFGMKAVALDAGAHRVVLADASTLDSDAVVITTGAGLRYLPGTRDLEGVYGLRTDDDAVNLRRALVALNPASRVVLVGAGFIGQEVATAAAAMNHQVTILEGLDLPLLPIVGPHVAELLLTFSASSGVALRCGVKVTSIEGPRDGALAGWVNIEGADPVPADLIVVGIGVTPSTAWLEDSGLTIENGVVTDRHLFAGPGIVAAGDVARFHWNDAGHNELVRIEHWQMAVDQGVHAAKSLLAGPKHAETFAAVPYFWSDQWGKKIQVLGHPSADDDVSLAIVPDEEGRFLAIYHHDDFITGVLAVSKPRQLMAFRPLLVKGSTLSEAKDIAL
jgi:NADPH-dependent 2,4-dienoyl-CoA reductase/sulfur reductase-like enzyme